MFSVTIDVKEIINTALELEAAGKRTPNAISNAINWTLDRAYTQVKKSVSAQTGIKQGDLESRSKGLGKKFARPSDLNADIYAVSGHTPLSYFNPSQRNAGVMASPWGRRQFFTGAFVATMKSGHEGVWGRGKGQPRYIKRRNAQGRVYYSDVNIRELWGPSIAKEMGRSPTVDVFKETVAKNIGARISHEMEFEVFKKIKSAGRAA